MELAVDLTREQHHSAARGRLPVAHGQGGPARHRARGIRRAPDDPAAQDKLLLGVGVLHRRADAPEDVVEVEGADKRPQDQQSDDEPGVADAVGDERLVGRVRGALPFVIEADEQVRADAHQLPADEHLEKVVGQDEVEHREAE